MEEHHLRLEIQLLREELRKMTALQDHINHYSFGNLPFLDLAEKAMNELTTLVNVNDPLWIQIAGEGGVVVESLNLGEYVKLFPPCLEIKSNSNSIHYASRASGFVAANSSTILHTLMNENQWIDLFPTIIGKSAIIDMVGEGNGTTLPMMYAELQAISSLIPVRKVMFLRFSRQLGEGKWGIVDVSVENSHDISETNTILNCRRFPSGCVFQDMPEGGCRVTWVEHLDYKEENEFNHPLGLMSCSSSFGAQRWLSSLQRQCLCLAIITSPRDQISGLDGDVLVLFEGIDIQARKKSMACMAHRMVRNFGFGVCSTGHQWQLVQAGETRVTIRDNNRGEPTRVVVSASNSLRMPISHQRLFNLLSLKYKHQHRSTKPIKELVRIDKSNDNQYLNNVSLILFTRVSNDDVPILQETQSDGSGSILVYGRVTLQGMQVLMEGRDPSLEEILPTTGFCIVPIITKVSEFDIINDSCMLTVAFQMLTKNNSPGNMNLSRQTIENINKLMSRRIQKIKSAINYCD